MKKIYVEEGGAIVVRTEPDPVCQPRYCLTDTQFSLISAGTETSHIMTMRKPENRGQGPRRIGYSNSGIVRTVGAEATRFAPGDLVGCYGGGFADHQSVCAMPRTLMAPCPDGVDPKHAAFVGVATFGLNGLRQCQMSFGETVAIIGLGLIGQITAQIARAAGYRVVGITGSDYLVELAASLGVPVCVRKGCPDIDAAVDMGGAPPAPGRPGGFDAALICSGSHDSNEDLLLAQDIVRDQGAVSIVGNVKMAFPRAAAFERESRLTIARAAGPGRYDPVHEIEAQEIPHSHVRWTEGRNCEEVLRMIGDGKLNVAPLISHVFPVDQAPDAYDLIVNRPRECLGVLIDFR